jgi:hypothetical protein
MLEKILKLYAMYMAHDVRSPMPHLFGPPGCGKSTVAEQAADLIGVNLHIINVSRISPLEIEGVQMPTGENEDMALRMLPATFWTQLEEGDILLLDEFLRAFPEVYNGLLDILTARRVGGHVLPRVFIMAASNSVVSYDKALADRLLHIPAEDPRKKKSVRKKMATLMVNELGLMPEMVASSEMEDVFADEINPMFNVLDALDRGGNSGQAPMSEGRSIRNLIGQAKLREVQSPSLATLIAWNNTQAAAKKKWQYVLLLNGKDVPQGYEQAARQLVGNPKLTEIQAINLDLNLQLIETEAHLKEKGTADEELIDDDDLFS